ncbi:MAG: aminopeptidase [Lachnoclostridium sp.]|nr:aminopeptidase [Lachnospira sp.]MCM1249133.1 aminopeptidase [Lachnoclostridium sp.]MCM1535121.1 aminopeptidase [Clostridium sp.]
MENGSSSQDMGGLLEERWQLCLSRIREISEESREDSAMSGMADYFKSVADFVLLIEENYAFLKGGGLKKASLDALKARNQALYADILPSRYEESFANPAFAVKKLGETFGALLSAVYAEMRSLIGFVYEMRLEEMVVRAELFLEIYTAFVYQWRENAAMPPYEDIHRIFYWFISDYADMAAVNRVKELVEPENNFAVDIIENSDFTDLRYLFAYGEYVGENELVMAEFLANLPEETIASMADTYTEGYRIGFEVGNKDLSKKTVVDIRYHIGFERMMRRAVDNFRKMALQPVCYRAAVSQLYNPSLFKSGFCSTSPNRQYEFDHKDDRALFLDKNYCNRKLEVTRTAFEDYKAQARGYAGPAVVETFGERSFEPVNKPESIKMSEEQNRLWVEYRSKAGEQQRNYIIEEERSFTIIAFPLPEIKEVLPKKTDACFGEFFREIIRLNTLDYKKYQKIQQALIDVLDTAVYCEIKGCGGNETDLKVRLYPLKNPEKETIFENCVADVNIPVGEVFTSPVLTGTEGILQVSRVYLNGLEYKNLRITFKDGMVQDYGCDNYAQEKDNRNFIKQNVLFRHDTLPMGEFAIGTNTAAYVTAKKYGVEGKLPILIAEKTGPHFAVGDTCYSHGEEVRVYNPDGKEIVAKDNERSGLRSTDPAKAYFNCHTDITIPYDELGELTAVKESGERIPLIKNGRFVLPGTEELNEAFATLKNS